MGYRKMIHAVIPALRKIVYGLAAGIRQSQYSGGLVKALTGRIISGTSYDFHICVVTNIHKHGVAAGYGNTEKGRLQLRVCQIVCGYMPTDMMNGYKRNAQGQSTGLCEVHSNQYRTNKPRSIGYGHGINILSGNSGSLNSTLGQYGNGLHVASGSYLRHHSAVYGVQPGLGENLIGEYLSAVFHQGYGSFITGGFKCKYFQMLRLISKNVSLV